MAGFDDDEWGPRAGLGGEEEAGANGGGVALESLSDARKGLRSEEELAQLTLPEAAVASDAARLEALLCAQAAPCQRQAALRSLHATLGGACSSGGAGSGRCGERRGARALQAAPSTAPTRPKEPAKTSGARPQRGSGSGARSFRRRWSRVCQLEPGVSLFMRAPRAKSFSLRPPLAGVRLQVVSCRQTSVGHPRQGGNFQRLRGVPLLPLPSLFADLFWSSARGGSGTAGAASAASEASLAAREAVLPTLEALVVQPWFDGDCHLEAAAALEALSAEAALTEAELEGSVLPAALAALKSAQGGAVDVTDVTCAWAAVLCVCVPLVGAAARRAVAEWATAAAADDVNLPGPARAAAVRAAAAAAGACESTAEADGCGALPAVLDRCQDTEAEVREAACAALVCISGLCGRLGCAALLQRVLPELRELVGDEDARVRGAVVGTVAALRAGELLSADEAAALALPAVRALAADTIASTPDDGSSALPLSCCLVSAARLVGGAADAQVAEASAATRELLEAWRTLAGDAERPDGLRAAYMDALPALVAALRESSVPSPSFELSLLPTLERIVASEDGPAAVAAFRAAPRVLAELTSGGETARTAAAAALSGPVVEALLDIDAPAERGAAAAALGATLLHVAATATAAGENGATATTGGGAAAQPLEPPPQPAVFGEALASLLSDEGLLQVECRHWRAQECALRALAEHVTRFDEGALQAQTMPACLTLLVRGVVAVRPAAAALFAAIVRAHSRAAGRAEMCARAVRELALARGYRARQAFVDVCEAMLHALSCRRFREDFLSPCLELLADPVALVRLRAVRLLPALKQVIRLPEDVAALERLNHASAQLVADDDRDVAAEARVAVAAFKSTALRAGWKDAEVPENQRAFEEADRAKEEAESEALLREEGLERRRAEEERSRQKREFNARLTHSEGKLKNRRLEPRVAKAAKGVRHAQTAIGAMSSASNARRHAPAAGGGAGARRAGGAMSVDSAPSALVGVRLHHSAAAAAPRRST